MQKLLINTYTTPLDLFEPILLNLAGCPWLTIMLNYKLSNLTLNSFLFILLVTYIITFFKKYNTLSFNFFTTAFNFIFQLLKTIIREILLLENNIHMLLFLLLFLLLLFCNITGILPYSLSIISHFSITFTLAFIFFIGFNIISIKKHKLNYLNLFLPHGTPTLIIPFIVGIELISYVTRIFSLSIRLFANIISGHTLLKILSSFAWLILLNGSIWIFLFFFPFTIICLITSLEFIIALLQAYVFVILLLIYLKDALHTSH